MVMLVPAGYLQGNKTELQNKQCKFPEVFENNKLKCTGCPDRVLAGGRPGGERLTLCDEQCITGAMLL